jgi:putative transposase
MVKDPLGWHICFRIQALVVAASANPGSPVGVDRGVVHTMAVSNGQMLDMRSLLSQGEKRRLHGLQRKAAGQQLAFKEQRARDPMP